MKPIIVNNIQTIPTRDGSIDFLRVLGLCMVTLVHFNIPYVVELVVYCGVPLMVFVSGLCVKSTEMQFSWSALFHRAKRLMVPLWLFLTMYWLLFYRIVQPSLYQVVQGYALLGVVPYVWIIRVFLIIAILSPLFVKTTRTIKSPLMGGAFALCAILLQELFCYGYAHINLLHLPIIKNIMRDYILYMIPYSMFFISAIYFKTVEIKKQILCVIAATLALIIGTIYFKFNSTDWESSYWLFLYKYPPRYMYTLYGLFGAQLLYLFHKHYDNLGRLPFIAWVSKNSLWIYFYHIPCLNFIPYNAIGSSDIPGIFIFDWAACMMIACVITWLQNKVVFKAKHFVKTTGN